MWSIEIFTNGDFYTIHVYLFILTCKQVHRRVGWGEYMVIKSFFYIYFNNNIKHMMPLWQQYLIKIRCLIFIIWQNTNMWQHSVWGHFRVHILTKQIREEPTKSFGIKTKYMGRYCPIGQYV